MQLDLHLIPKPVQGVQQAQGVRPAGDAHHDGLAGLRPLVGRYPIIGDVRGSGLFLGIELVRDRETLEPAAEETAFVVNRLREEGILAGTEGPLHNVIKIRPPMPFSESDADFLVATMARILAEDFQEDAGSVTNGHQRKRRRAP